MSPHSASSSLVVFISLVSTSILSIKVNGMFAVTEINGSNRIDGVDLNDVGGNQIDRIDILDCRNVFFRRLLWPCGQRCSRPDKLICSGALVDENTLRKLENRIRNLLNSESPRWLRHIVQRRLKRIKRLLIEHTNLSELNNPLFRRFNLTGIVFLSNDFLHKIHLSSFNTKIALNDFRLENMKVVLVEK